MPTTIRSRGAALFAAALVAGLGVVPAEANDTSAALGIGGLEFIENPAVAMKSEDLYISPTEVKVRYVFHNASDKDVTSIVAFPLPLMGPLRDDQNISLPEPKDGQAIAFQTTVDGKPVETSVEEKAFVGGLDRTTLVTEAGLPLQSYLMETLTATDALPADKRDPLVAAGVIRLNEWDDGSGMKQHAEPDWSYRATYYWTQTFPAGAETVIEHRYTPAAGMSQGTMLADPASFTDDWSKAAIKEMTALYCIDKSFFAGAAKAEKAQQAKNNNMKEIRLDYVLKTGANWRGPIADFRLVIDKGAADALVSFCGDGVKKIGPTTFEMKKTDFNPTEDINVLILSKDFSMYGGEPAPQ